MPIANAVFTPTPAEVAVAEQIIRRFDDKARSGLGAFEVGGRMVDAAVVRSARSVVELARTVGTE